MCDRKTDGPTAGRTGNWTAEKIEARIANWIEEKIDVRIGRRIDGKIVGPIAGENFEGLIGLITLPMTMAGRAATTPVRFRWTGGIVSSESNGLSAPSARNERNVPRDRNGRGEISCLSRGTPLAW